MATCAHCPVSDNQVPDAMIEGHMRLMHGGDIGTLVGIEFSAPAGAHPDEVSRWAPCIGQTLRPILEKLHAIEQNAWGSFAAGWADGWAESVRKATGRIREDAAAARADAGSGSGAELGLLRAIEHIVAAHAESREQTTPEVLSAGDILYALSGGENPHYADLELAVAVAPAKERFDYKTQRMVGEESWFPFQPGEMIVVNQDGREPFGEGRHCRKWGIEFEYFRDLGAARARRAEVLPDAA